MKLFDEIKQLEQDMIEDRRYLHQNPELSGQEYETTAFVQKRLEEFGAEIEPLDMETGISAIIRGSYPGKTVCIRHDIDALPIQEETGLPFVSLKKNVSHSCGHDIHTVTALYCAKILSRYREKLHGNVRIVFQPSEENIRGAKEMVRAGLMDLEPRQDLVIGLHTHPATDAGDICLRKGPMEAAVDFIRIIVRGKGGHGAYPHTGVDPVLTSAYLVSQLQSVISRESQAVKPAVFTIGSIHGGETNNTIPDEVVMLASLRSLYQEERIRLLESIRRITTAVCAGMGAEGIVEVGDNSLPPLYNDEAITEQVIQAANEILGEGHVVELPFPSMGSDDFSVFMEYSKGVQFFLGTGNNQESSRLGLHKGQNVFDEGCMVPGVAVLVQFVMNYLQK